MSRRLAVIMDPIESIKPQKDSTLAMLLEAQNRGWTIHYGQLADIWLRDGEAHGRLCQLNVADDPVHWFDPCEVKVAALGDMDVILMRKDPPFDMSYIFATYVLQRAEEHGALVVNRPQGLRDGNCKVILETLTDNGSRYVMTQKYLPEITETGDKRIILIDGKPVPLALVRIPSHGDHRGNMCVGAQAQVTSLTDRDRWICDQIGPVLRDNGLLFAGIDVIGDFMTEVNITSPTGIRELERESGVRIAEQLFDAISSNFA